MGRRKKRITYEITPEIKKEIIDYCNGLILLMNPNLLKDNGILENEFLEYLFASCEVLYSNNKTYKLNSSELIALIQHKHDADFAMAQIEQGIAVITNIDKYDNLIFDYKHRIENK